jgi:drug/metabolite transporter (DMT)-like permease
MGPQFFTSVAMSAAGPVVVLHFFLSHPVSALAVDGHGLLLMLAIGTISTVVPAYCISAGIGLIGPERTAMIGNISPVVTVGLAVGILGEAFTVWHAAGTVLVLLGVWLFGRKGKVKVPEVDVEP